MNWLSLSDTTSPGFYWHREQLADATTRVRPVLITPRAVYKDAVKGFLSRVLCVGMELAPLTDDHVEERQESLAALQNLVAVIHDVHGQHADDCCWLDIDRIFTAAGLPVPDRRVGDKMAMLVNCKKFISAMCADGGWKTYAELEAESNTLREQLELALLRRDALDAENKELCAEIAVLKAKEHN